MIIAIDHGYYAIKTRETVPSRPTLRPSVTANRTPARTCSRSAGVFLLRQRAAAIQRDKTANDNYYLLTLAAIAQELQARGAPRECGVTIAAGLPLTSYGREKPAFPQIPAPQRGPADRIWLRGKEIPHHD